MGRSINAQDNPQSEYVKAIHDMGRIIMVRFARPWLQFEFLYKRTQWGRLEKKSLEILHKFSLDTIKQRKMEYKRLKSQKIGKEETSISGKKKRQAFLDLLIEYSEENEFLTEENIREEVDTFMFEGHDTTAAGINWAIYLIGRHPEIQEKVYRELELIFGRSERPASSADIREMKYLECCIKESLRLIPSVPFFARNLTEDMIIAVILYALHRDPKHFPDPLKFQPERFLPENSMKRNPYAYVPFSAGPRNCIGQKFALLEEKVVLSSLFRKFRVESLGKFEDLKLTGDLIMRPEEEMFVKIFPRNET
ncbi:putative cytochrome P450 [Armadillidium nasatum]|uniref:Putative cytochrome P450 n=1 Tax=Armadillidium nasatum TaxID=96803 RepID=A0A5N5TJ36_9CRUS|nr:putative cytochrome P450 [Armadillidium nasatum]